MTHFLFAQDSRVAALVYTEAESVSEAFLKAQYSSFYKKSHEMLNRKQWVKIELIKTEVQSTENITMKNQMKSSVMYNHILTASAPHLNKL